MIIYSVEIHLEEKITKKWVSWMLKKHIPDIMDTKLFTKYTFLKNVENPQKYVIKYELEKMEDYMKYKKDFSLKLQKEHEIKFKNYYQATRTISIKK